MLDEFDELEDESIDEFDDLKEFELEELELEESEP